MVGGFEAGLWTGALYALFAAVGATLGVHYFNTYREIEGKAFATALSGLRLRT